MVLDINITDGRGLHGLPAKAEKSLCSCDFLMTSLQIHNNSSSLTFIYSAWFLDGKASICSNPLHTTTPLVLIKQHEIISTCISCLKPYKYTPLDFCHITKGTCHYIRTTTIPLELKVLWHNVIKYMNIV